MMDNEEDRIHNLNSLEGRLRLKKSYKESIDNQIHLSDDSNNECKKNDSISINVPQSSCVDDSIMDFKSPKKFMSLKNINSNKLLDKPKKKVSHSKIKIINNKKKADSNKLLQNKKNIHDTQQTSIESSFFKTENKMNLPQSPANVKTAYVCPLCFKNLKDENSQAVHMKSCAIKNNVSTKKLLNAMELQERQAAERKSLGLLSAPILQDKKKPAPRKATFQDDFNLELGLAISTSLYQQEEMEILDEAEIIAISSGPSLPDSNKECSQRTTLQSFGFTSNRSVSPTNNYPINKMKRRKLNEPTILQRRTAVERERILAERIAEILMGHEDFTQNTKEENEQSIDVKEKVVIKSKLLQELHKTENTLWDRTRLTPSKNVFYVTQLSSQIIPLPEKNYKLNEEQNVKKFTDRNDKESLTKEPQEIKEMQTVSATDSNEELTISSNEIKIYCKETFLNTLATDWRNILNDSSASDIIVFVKNSRHIWVHKLVFYVRCTNILLDVISNDTEFSTAKEKICWIDVDYDVALAFLEFIYCGTIDKYSKIHDSKTSLFAIRSLARKYKVNDLFVYLRQRKFEFNLTEPEYEKSTENIISNVGKALNIPEFDKFTCKTSPKHHTRNDLKNTQYVQKTLLQEDISSTFQSPGNRERESYVLAEDSCIVEDEKTVSMKSLEQISSENNTSRNRGISLSPDIFDDTLDVIKLDDKSTTYSKGHEDSSSHILLSLIKQDADININSQELTKKTDNAKYSELDENIFACLKNEEQNVMKILKPSDDLHKDSLIDTPQNSKPKAIEKHSSNTARQKSNLTLSIERIQRENAKLDSDLDSDLDITTYPNKMSPRRYSNPFCIYKWGDSDNENAESDNYKQSSKTRKKLGKLSIIEQRMRSFADKNPEFYSVSSDKCVPDVKQTNALSTLLEKMTEFSRNDTKLCDYSQNISTEEDDTSDLVNIEPLSIVHSLHTKTTNQSFNESIYDLKADERGDETEISMYSKYMRNHHDNSIAKYRPAIKRNALDGNQSDESALSDILNKSGDTNENDIAMTQSFLTQKDTDVIISSDTEVESVFSSDNYPVDLHNDDSNYKDYPQFSKKTGDNKQDIEKEESNNSPDIEEIPKAIATDSEEQKDINSTTKSDRIKFNDRDMTPDIEDAEINMIFTQTRSDLNESNKDEIDNHREEFIPSPIMVFSSPDLNTESPSFDKEHCIKHVSETNSRKSRKSTKFSFNFEEDIYLANVDVDKYEKNHTLQKSKSASVLNIAEFKKDNLRRCNNKNSRKNIIDDYKTTNNIIQCESLDHNTMTLTQNSTDVRKFKRKSLSEQQISINKLRDQKDISEYASVQFQYNYSQNIGNIKTVSKIIDKDVTPPPDYDGMKTPELDREMKRYGLKVQKRCRTVKLLKHIYNELHPLVPIDEINTEREIAEVSSDEEGPPAKKLNTNDNSIKKLNNLEDELPCSQDRYKF
ncbi:uncharacterized protein LOC116851091 isoform X2 [Odontomachus brunneus]|uniref:uncharacterized protein LOC116851091 isoform X2 n=1 Tax=Odontomachus brunneus TaxID=486640 RepID=UPI0013F206F0|nr:uncharacterized protein LOC116851091 isoform X2 [Odontomachus brunneus]